jgi:hypothetical protein
MLAPRRPLRSSAPVRRKLRPALFLASPCPAGQGYGPRPLHTRRRRERDRAHRDREKAAARQGSCDAGTVHCRSCGGRGAECQHVADGDECERFFSVHRRACRRIPHSVHVRRTVGRGARSVHRRAHGGGASWCTNRAGAARDAALVGRAARLSNEEALDRSPRSSWSPPVRGPACRGGDCRSGRCVDARQDPGRDLLSESVRRGGIGGRATAALAARRGGAQSS